MLPPGDLKDFLCEFRFFLRILKLKIIVVRKKNALLFVCCNDKTRLLFSLICFCLCQELVSEHWLKIA